MAAGDGAASESASVRPAAPARARARVVPRLRERSGLRVGSFLLAPVYALYTRRLRSLALARRPPHHVAVILDGNRRWATRAGLDEPGAGHRRGADRLVDLIGWCVGLKIAELTVWALSNENLTRPKDEVDALTRVLGEELAVLAERTGRHGAGVRIRVFGQIGRASCRERV